MIFRFFDGRLDIEVSWDHGPELWITVYGRRTQIIMLSYNAYPVLGKIERMPRIGEPYGEPGRQLRSDEVLPGVTAEEYTLEDLYRDSPTDTPLLKMLRDSLLPRHGKNRLVVDRMIEAMEAIANDPISDPKMQEKIREAGTTVERQMFGPDTGWVERQLYPTTTAGLHCAICGIGVTTPVEHDVDMCGVCHRHLKGLPPVTYISDGHGVTRAFTFGTGAQSFVVVMSYTALGALQRYEIGSALAQKYRRATAKAEAYAVGDDDPPGPWSHQA